MSCNKIQIYAIRIKAVNARVCPETFPDTGCTFICEHPLKHSTVHESRAFQRAQNASTMIVHIPLDKSPIG